MAQAGWSPGAVWIIRSDRTLTPPPPALSPEASVLAHITPKGPPPRREGVRATIPIPGVQRPNPCFQPPPPPISLLPPQPPAHPASGTVGRRIEAPKDPSPIETTHADIESPAALPSQCTAGSPTREAYHPTATDLGPIPARSGMVRRHKPRRSPTTQRTAEKEEWGGASPRTGRGGLHGTRAASAAHPHEHVN
jgi:hypothetical protein